MRSRGGSAEPPASDTPLAAYVAKRRPSRTPEPMPQPTRRRGRRPRFVIQEHHARALHWDLRLEHDGVLVSWALPKGLPADPQQNHLAVHTEDHPLEYERFEGDIPKGEYGGGRVTIWDHGVYELEKWRDDEVMVILHGRRAEGRYVLFATSGRNWMIHRMDPAPEGYAPMPSRIEPMLAVTAPLPAEDEAWAFEAKWDGVRAVLYVEGGRARALTRNDKDLTATFPEFREIAASLGSTAAVLDGELVAFDAEGRSSFGLLQRRLHLSNAYEIRRRATEVPARYMVFDVLYLDGRVLVELPYEQRRAVLERLELRGDRVAVTDSVRGHGAALLEASRELGLEGVIAKRRSAPYRPGARSDDWRKVKNFRTQEVVIGGWTEGKGTRRGGFGALLLGIPSAAGPLDYVGKVGTGFSEEAQRELLARLEPLARTEQPFASLPASDRRGAHFVEPVLVGEVRFGEWTGDRRLRHPSWRGLREDKVPAEVRREP